MTSLTIDNLDSYRQRIAASASRIAAVMERVPDFLIILGSGLGNLANQVERPICLPYEKIEGFPQATVPGHAGQLILGEWCGQYAAVMKGRFHAYEGHSPADLVLPVRVMQKLGVKHLILTNAAGGIDAGMKPGNLMLIRDHISLWADSPLRGQNLDEFGSRFPDQTRVYDRELARIAIDCAQEIGMTLYEGIYAYCRGPQFETPAEIRLLRLLGASAAGMSTVPEAIAASHGGMRVLALSCITNLAAGILDQPLSHQEVLEVGARAEQGTIRLLSMIISKLNA
jgi:purine-nucleoside phosphorylase